MTQRGSSKKVRRYEDHLHAEELANANAAEI
jgi:hypothetical protein